MTDQKKPRFWRAPLACVAAIGGLMAGIGLANIACESKPTLAFGIITFLGAILAATMVTIIYVDSEIP